MRLRRFGLRHLFAFMIIVAVLLASVASLLRRASKQDAAIARLQEAGARVEIAYRGPAWLDRLGCRRLRRVAVGVTFATLGTNFRRRLLQEGDNLPDLVWLDLQGTSVADDALNDVARMKKLRTLYLDYTGITAVGLGALSRLEKSRGVES